MRASRTTPGDYGVMLEDDDRVLWVRLPNGVVWRIPNGVEWREADAAGSPITITPPLDFGG